MTVLISKPKLKPKKVEENNMLSEFEFEASFWHRNTIKKCPLDGAVDLKSKI